LYVIKYQCAIWLGQYEDALNYALTGLKVAQKIGEGIQIPLILGYAATGALYAGQSEYAFQLAQKGEIASEQVGHPLGQILTSVTKALVLLRSGRIEESLAPARRALQLCRQLKLNFFLMKTLETNAEILAELKPPDKKQIIGLLDEAALLVERSGSPWFQIEYLMAKIRTDMKLKRFGEAEKGIASVRDLYRAMNVEKGTEELRTVEIKLADLMASGKR
jgi:hypothetical protein